MTGSAPLMARGISKAYRGVPVLREVDFEVRSGEAVGLVGSNGSGKSTLLGCLTANRLPDRGSVAVCGHDPFSDPGGAARCTGFVPEHPFLYDELTVGEVLSFVVGVRGMDSEAAGAEADRLFSLFGLEDVRPRYCGELSQGMGRKVALTLAMLHDPEVLILDEATNGLDRPSVDQLMGELERRRRTGAAVLMSSHDLDVLATHCDRGLLLEPGAVWRMLEGDEWEAWREAPSLSAGRDGPGRDSRNESN